MQKRLDTIRALAEQQQWAAARDSAPQVRLVAGPGTGKTYTIEKKVADLLNNGANPANVYVISFTRAACAELRSRIQAFCNNQPCAITAPQIRVSTMHALALRILRLGNLLSSYPSGTPIMLDDWEHRYIYDRELASTIGCTPTRATEIRLAHDARWQTLNSEHINQARVTPAEIQGFNAFHAARTNLYSCVLPGEIIFKCVEALQQGALLPTQLPLIDHLIVDEFQDLNVCDQEFVRLLSAQNTTLFIAGDDDQSIYSFRHANPDGIVQFDRTYPLSSTHVLTDCFRCAPAILSSASQLIMYNPNRVSKNLTPLYGAAVPPVQGRFMVWSFPSAQQEARTIAESCRELINAGMAGREDDILILISNRKVQLNVITQELGNLGLPFEPPRGASLTDNESIRAVYSILRIAKDQASGEEDYPSYRDILDVLSGVGHSTANAIADACIINNQNFRQLFYLPSLPNWLIGRAPTAVTRISTITQTVGTWSMTDILAMRASEINDLLSNQVFSSGTNALNNIALWNTLASSLPQEMTLEELIQFLSADTESDQQAILDLVAQRIGGGVQPASVPVQKKIRILTMHGAKGLSGKVVFIPGVEEGIMPNSKAIRATGLLIEQRRLFYVSITRAMICCITSHSALHTGAEAMVLGQNYTVRLPRSQFLTQIGIPSVNRSSGLTQIEASAIVSDINNL
ncbi:MAG: ATP-dependent helicase [Thermodesulfovibrionales bacterium]